MSSLFETKPRERADRRRTLALLALIVAVGAFVRFWSLGNVGLHGDEKTMVLPTLHLLQYGTPDMPSGFLYPRAVAQVYLMAGSVLAFGRNEWALRFPSAACGVLLIVLAWAAGRRFLEPRWSLALAATVALLPGFIADAQTARMYVFLVTGVTGFMVLLFAWERTGRIGYLVAAVLEMAVTLQFHTLSVFAAWLCFLPGLASGDRRTPQVRLRLLWLGFAAFALVVGEFLALSHWIATEYPHDVDSITGAVANAPRAAAAPLDPLWPLLAAVPAFGLSWLAIRARGLLPVALLTLSLMAQVSRLDHVAILLIIAALVLARREGKLSAGRLAIYFGTCLLLAAAQVGYLLAHRAGTPSQVLGLLLGWPSVRPFIVISRYSRVAALIAACGVATGLWRLAHRQRVPDHVLFFALGVWLPLLQIGYLRWDIAPRYAEAQIIPLLLAAFASAQWATRALAASRAARVPGMEGGGRPGGEAMAQSSEARTLSSEAGTLSVRPSTRWSRILPRFATGPGLGSVAALIVCLLLVDPLRLKAAVDPTYGHYPDHKGAAEFVESLHPKADDIIVAEDDLMQTYYLGHVDYWLVDKKVAAPFLHEVDGHWVDMYTNTPLIGTGRQLQRLVERRDRGAIYVIGSGENQQDGRRLMRGLGIAQVLDSSAFHLIYVGRDHLTDVWKVSAPRHALTAAAPPVAAAPSRAVSSPGAPGR